MKIHTLRARILSLTVVFVLSCPSIFVKAGQESSTQTEAGFMNVTPGFVDGTMVLGIIAEKFPRQKIVQQGWINKNWYPRVLEAGYSDADVADEDQGEEDGGPPHRTDSHFISLASNFGGVTRPCQTTA